MMSDNRSAITLLLMDLKSNRWQREITVSGILCGSVVAKINTTCFGGSSNVFRSALNALVEIICTSSIIYTLYGTALEAYFTLSRISRISSTLVLEAASISITSEIDPSKIPTQAALSLHGSLVGACSQLTVCANIFAALVFPVPRGPENKYAWEYLLCSSAFCSVLVICVCPTRSANVRGRQTRYNA